MHNDSHEINHTGLQVGASQNKTEQLRPFLSRTGLEGLSIRIMMAFSFCPFFQINICKLDRFRLGSNKYYAKLGNSTISFYSKQRPLAARLEKALPLAMATSKYIVDWQKSCRLKAISEFTFKCKELSDISLEITFQKRAILLPALRKGMPNCGIRGNTRVKYDRRDDT
jgi:hypothetical protein